jgi:hypothetical protein
MLGKRRNNYTQHDPETMDYLVHFNDWVGLYLWFGLIGIIGIVTFFNWAGKIQVSFRADGYDTGKDTELYAE